MSVVFAVGLAKHWYSLGHFLQAAMENCTNYTTTEYINSTLFNSTTTVCVATNCTTSDVDNIKQYQTGAT